MNLNRSTVYFVKISSSSFIEQDIQILKNHCNRLFVFRYSEKNHLSSLLRLSISLLIHIWRLDIIYIWFASYHSLLPSVFAKFFGKKCVIVIGGHDAADVPEYRYGVHRKFLRSVSNRISCNLADRLLSVSYFTYSNLLRYVSKSCYKNIEIVYNGLDTKKYIPDDSIQRKSRVLMVCGTKKINIARLKGVDHYMKTATRMSETTFMLVGLRGAAREWCEQLKPDNILLIDYLDREKLLGLMNATKVFCQFSRHDSFGMVLAEAMAMGCVPVGTAYGGTPEIMGKNGFLLSNYDINDTVNIIRSALNMRNYNIHIFRNHIINKFDLEIREKRIVEMIQLST